MMYKQTLEEMETTISFDRSSGPASIYTADPVMMRRLDKLAEEIPVLRRTKRDECGCMYECPKTMIKVQKPRQLPDEKRQELAERMRARNREG